MKTVHMVVPGGLDDPLHPSGGNVYDRRVCRGLRAIGWSVHEHPVPGPWPSPDDAARARLADVISTLPDDEPVLMDGLIASAVPDIVTAVADRLRVMVLLHLPLGVTDPAAQAAERTVLAAAVAVVTPSRWARQWLLDHYDLPPDRVRVAEPGVVMTGSTSAATGVGRLLCVGAVTPHKGHDLLVAALAQLNDLSWSCQVVGALDIAPGFAADVRRRAQQLGIAGRMSWLGPLTRDGLDAAYAGADVLVMSSRVESYGMVVTEAMACGLPVVAMSVGGVPEALGRDPDGRRPGLLVTPGDVGALATAIRAFVTDSSLRRRLRRSVADRRRSLPSWSTTSERVADTVASVALSKANDPNGSGRRIPSST
jgi:glycosyltransferase involved in cell wall biosynthesis